MSLFEAADYLGAPAEPNPFSLSTDVRRRLRNQTTIDRGIHPVTRLPLRGSGTCGECKFCVGRSLGNTYYKCRLDGDRFVTGGPATDVRLKWPACTSFLRRAEKK